MNRRVVTGVFAGLLAATVVLGVAGAAFRAGEHRDLVTRTVTDGNGQVVRVVDGDYGYGYRGWGPGYGWGPGCFLIPLLGIALVVLLVRGRRHAWGGWGPGGPGRWGGPPGPGAGPAEQAFGDWHRRAHGEQGEARAPTAPEA